MEEVEQLVDDVLARCPAITRESADRAGIIAGLCEAGASSLPALHSLAESDYAGLKDAIGSAAKLAFTAMLKSAVLKAYRCRPRKRHPPRLPRLQHRLQASVGTDRRAPMAAASECSTCTSAMSRQARLLRSLLMRRVYATLSRLARGKDGERSRWAARAGLATRCTCRDRCESPCTDGGSR